MRVRALVPATLLASAAPLLAQSPFATQVVAFQQGPGGGLFEPQNALGGPLGGGPGLGSLDVLTLGEGGSLTLGFDVVLRDGPGADLTVFENGFLVAGGPDVFAEVAFVEVSSDGTHFARFPSSYAPPPGGGSPIGTYGGLLGGTPVVANVALDPASPFDPVTSGGEALDLADLAADPIVSAGLLDLQAVRFVRLVDVVGGQDTDSAGTTIVNAGTADVDAVAALHHDAEAPGGPICELTLDAQGFVRLSLGDPDGFFDLDLASPAASLSLTPLPLGALLPAFQVTGFDGSVLELTSLAPIAVPGAGTGLTATLAVSVRDLGGAICGDQLVLQG